MIANHITISLFCGGRGSATLIRELVRYPQVRLNLLVNAYDDGLSTGALRDLIPGMLGPSDFRKNMSHLLELYSVQQFALSDFLEYRLPKGFAGDDLNALIRFVQSPANGVRPPAVLQAIFANIAQSQARILKEYLAAFFDFYLRKQETFDFSDCSMGNLLFSGAYLQNQGNFNHTTKMLSQLFGSKANLINVTNGENRILVGIKEDGELLEREAKIVSQQSATRISDIYLLATPLSEQEKMALYAMPLAEKKRYLEQRHAHVSLSAEAHDALRASDVILYGPGTQFSSLLPSYKTPGIAASIRESPASIKAFIVNIKKDHDVQQFAATDLVDQALTFLGDPDNRANMITHILYNRGSHTVEDGVRRAQERFDAMERYKNALWVEEDVAHPVLPGVHSGAKTVQVFFSMLESPVAVERDTLDIHIDLNSRSLATNILLQEFVELDWSRHFSKVRLFLNHTTVLPLTLPPYLDVRSTQHREHGFEGDMLSRWLSLEQTQYLVTLTGDGEYRLKDIFLGIHILKTNQFGALFGSRNQSRRQFLNSLQAAYSESKILYWISWFGAFCLTALFGMRFQIIFSDPLTGFRIYKRSALAEKMNLRAMSHKLTTATSLVRILLGHAIEIAEMPVSYRTFKGFTNVWWRLMRGLKNLRGFFG